jgi:hypothetical protein
MGRIFTYFASASGNQPHRISTNSVRVRLSPQYFRNLAFHTRRHNSYIIKGRIPHSTPCIAGPDHSRHDNHHFTLIMFSYLLR